MKKLTFIAGALFVMSLSSCTKEYTCTCVDSDGNETLSATYTSTKSAAETSCSANSLAWGTCTLD